MEPLRTDGTSDELRCGKWRHVGVHAPINDEVVRKTLNIRTGERNLPAVGKTLEMTDDFNDECIIF